MTSESAKRLRATIEELEAELQRIETLDPETRELLRATVAELQETLRRRRGGETIDDDSLLNKVEDLERDFQVRHPALAGILLRIVEALRQLGI